VSIAWAAGAAVEIPEEELNEALRRALVVRAVGGNPQREVGLDEEAVARLADELESPARRQELLVSIDALRSGSLGPRALEAADALLGDGDLAWQCFAAGQLAAELSL
jgi:hypothetical protein